MKPRTIVPLLAVLLLAGCAVAPQNTLNDAQRGELRDGSSAYQQQALDDLFVDESEYRASVTAWRDCVEAAGAEPSAIETRGVELGFDYEIAAASGADVDAIGAAVDACLPEYHDAIGRVWVSQPHA